MSAIVAEEPLIWKQTPRVWLAVAIAAVVLTLIYLPAFKTLVNWWSTREEYSHGFLIPFIAAFLIWQKKDVLEQVDFRGSWMGPLIVLAGGLVLALGKLSLINFVIQYSFLIVLVGLFLAYMGWRGFREVWLGLFILVFMIPLPNFVYHNLSSELQLISSQIGVWFIRLFGISVYLEGNVIDLGEMKLQVVDACSGLRYLFPLMALGVIIAIFYKAALWKRWFIFLSSIPITILMNSFRIGAIGVTVEYWGPEMAEGFLHDFEGWVVFMAAFAVLLLEIWVLTRATGDKRPFREVFAIDLPGATPPEAVRRDRPVPKSFLAAIGVLVGIFAVSVGAPERKPIFPDRNFLDAFPLEIGAWRGDREQMEQQYIDVLHFDDYLLVDYRRADKAPINLYIAYYDIQQAGEGTIHSPRSCLPGGGWRIKSLTQESIDGVRINDQPLRVNRVLMTMGDQKALVYYWLQQRGRIITSEYMAKWWLFWDGLTKSRTDGALVRLTMPLSPGITVEEADRQLVDFSTAIASELPYYIPD